MSDVNIKIALQSSLSAQMKAEEKHVVDSMKGIESATATSGGNIVGIWRKTYADQTQLANEAKEARLAQIRETIKATETEADRVAAAHNRMKNSTTATTQSTSGLRTEIDKLGDHISGQFTSTIKNLATGFVAVDLAMKLTEGFKQGYKDAKELQSAQIQLTQTLGFYSDALDEQSESMSKNNLIGKGEIVTAQLRLGNYIKEEDQVKRLMPAILDLSKAKGIDLASAADMVGKSISKDTGELGRFGIELVGTAGSVEKIDSAIDGMTKRFGGQAEELFKYSSMWDKIGFSVKEAWEAVGKFGTMETPEDTYKIAKGQLKVTGIFAPTPEMRTSYEKIVADFDKKNFENRQKSALDNIMEQQKSESKRKKEELEKNAKKEADSNEKAFKESMSRYEEQQKYIHGFLKKDEEKARNERIEKRQSSEKEEISSETKKWKEIEKGASDNKKFLDKLNKDKEKGIEILAKAHEKFIKKTNKAEMTVLKEKQKEELDLAKDTGKDTTELEKVQSDERIELAKRERDFKIQMAMDHASGIMHSLSLIADATKANAQVKKRIAEGEVIIDTAKTIMSIWSGTTSQIEGPVGVALAVVETVLAGAVGVAQIAKIESTQFAYGGIARGGIPGVDSIPATLMPGEIVYNPARPNPALASMIGAGNTSTNNSQNTTIHMPQIVIQGNADSGTVASIGKVTQKALINALKAAQVNGNVTAPGLVVRH